MLKEQAARKKAYEDSKWFGKRTHAPIVQNEVGTTELGTDTRPKRHERDDLKIEDQRPGCCQDLEDCVIC